jgi:integrase
VDVPRNSEVKPLVLDEEQTRVFLGEARRSSPHYRFYLAAVTTGMRAGELMGLRWKDVDLLTGTVSVQQTFYRLGRQQLFGKPKSEKSRRIVVLPPILVEELRRLREEQAEAREKLGAVYEDLDLVFCQPNGRPLHLNNIRRGDFGRLLKRAGLPQITIHCLRHSHATQLLRQGVHPKIVQERLGHSTAAFTLQVYSHVLPGMQEQAVADLQARLFGEKSVAR